MKYLLILILISFNFSISAATQNDFYYVDKKNCDLRLAPLVKEFQFLNSEIITSLKKKGYKALPFFDSKRVIPDEEYIQFNIYRTKDFWKKCVIEIVIRKSKGNIPNKTDRLILKHQTIRSIPRVTPSGNERCTRALRDILVHLPYCKLIK